MAVGEQATTLARAFKSLGAPTGRGRALVVAPDLPDLAAAVKAELSPRAVVAQDAAGGEDAYDLLVTSGWVDQGSLADLPTRLGALCDRLADSGLALVHLRTYAASEPDVRHDALLFPVLAAGGSLGDRIKTRTPLMASSWMLALGSAGLAIRAVAGFGQTPLDPKTIMRHGARLSVFDPGEMATGDLLVICERRGGA